jgi:hypothetical protein
MRTHPRELTGLLLTALVHEREREITDPPAESLIATVRPPVTEPVPRLAHAHGHLANVPGNPAGRVCRPASGMTAT